LGLCNNKAIANTVMALAADTQAKSPVDLSTHPLFHYQNTSVSKSIASLASDAQIWTSTELNVQHLVQLHVSRQMMEQPVLYLQTDATPVRHPHSPTLEGKTYIYVPNNVVPGNKPLDAGYQVSSVNVGEAQSSWSLPLSLQRIGAEQDAKQCAVGQLERLFAPGEGILPLRKGQLNLNAADTGYAHPSFVAPLRPIEDLVNVVRLRSGSKIWDADPLKETGGAPRVYAETPLYLNLQTQQHTHRKGDKTWVKQQDAITTQPPDEEIVLERSTKTGRALRVHLRRWNDMMWRSKQGHNMHDKPFDVLLVEITDAASGKPVFKNPLWIGIHGVRKDEVSAETAYEGYRHRYDIEPAFRFEKQHLMLEKYQPLNVQHFDNWLLIVLLSFWLLFTASEEVQYIPKKWQKYPLGAAEKVREQSARWTPARTKAAATALFCTFDQTRFLPQKCKKVPPGRQKGDVQTPRPHYQIVKKGKKK
jgi:hypothetical protein